MTIKQIIQESINKNPLGLKEAVAEELRARIALALETKMEESVELEEDEQLDELDKKTLTSYAKKSEKDSKRLSKAISSSGKPSSRGGENVGALYAKKQNRETGIERAKERLAKESVELEEAKASGTYAKVEYNYSDDFWHIEVVKDGKSVAKADGYIGANAVGNPLITKFVEMVKKAGLKPEGMKIVSDWEDYTEGVFKNNTFKWNKKSVKESLDEAKMTDAEVLSAAKALAANGKDEKTKAFGKGLVDFYKKEGSFTPAQVGGLQNIMKNASFQMAKDK